MFGSPPPSIQRRTVSTSPCSTASRTSPRDGLFVVVVVAIDEETFAWLRRPRRAPSSRLQVGNPFCCFYFSRATRPRAVRVSSRSLLVQRDQWDISWGPKKLISGCRDTDDATMAGASVESCRFVVLMSPRGCLGSVLDVRKRLRRMRGRFHR